MNQKKFLKVKNLFFFLVLFTLTVIFVGAQEKPSEPKPAEEKVVKKINQRPENKGAKEKFDDADVKTMANQCIKFETELGNIEIELFPESAPETVRNFLNLTSLGVFDTTVFSRIVPDFIIQGGNISTRETRTPELTNRARRIIPDEPSLIKHERGIVSMARGEEPNTASSNFFILVGNGSHLDGTFAAFGRVTSGMETVDAISKTPVVGDKPEKPVKLNKASIFSCVKPVQ